VIGRVASQLDAPFSDATCIAHFTLPASSPSSCIASEIDFYHSRKILRKNVGKYNLCLKEVLGILNITFEHSITMQTGKTLASKRNNPNNAFKRELHCQP